MCGLSAKELARFDADKRVIAVLGNLRLPFDRFHSAARAFRVTEASYRWLVSLPGAS